MSWFDWLKSKPAAHSGDSGHTMDLSAGDHLNDAAFRSPGNDVDFKAQRQTRRENLYAVVREAMIRSEVLASRYKFKVLSLDTHGRQFLVMVDLMDATALPAHRFLAVEQLIVSHAAQQHGLFVKSVYWRSNEALPEPHHAPVAVHQFDLDHRDARGACGRCTCFPRARGGTRPSGACGTCATEESL